MLISAGRPSITEPLNGLPLGTGVTGVVFGAGAVSEMVVTGEVAAVFGVGGCSVIVFGLGGLFAGTLELPTLVEVIILPQADNIGVEPIAAPPIATPAFFRNSLLEIPLSMPSLLFELSRLLVPFKSWSLGW